MKSAKKQIALKPQDIVLLLKLSAHQGRVFTYASIAEELAISASEAHASLERAHSSRLVSTVEPAATTLVRAALLEFLVHGLKYSFPGVFGSISRGVPTGFAGPSLRQLIIQSAELAHVWPHEHGTTRGLALYPLYPSVPIAALRDSALYDTLTLVDAIRAGAAREREIATDMLTARLA